MKIIAVFSIRPYVLLITLSVLLLTPHLVRAADDIVTEDDNPRILISEVLTRSETDARHEFIELYNPNEFSIDILEWRVEYSPATNENWTDKIRAQQHVTPNFIIEPHSFYLLATEDYSIEHPDVAVDQTIRSGSAESGGHIRLLRPDGGESYTLVDIIGWGGAQFLESPNEPVSVAPRGASYTLCFEEELAVHSGINSVDFIFSDTPLPLAPLTCTDTEMGDDGAENEEDALDDEGEQETNHEDENAEYPVACEGVVISEVLPNPQGPRSLYPREDHAFVELHNPTVDYIPLDGCGIQASSSSYTHWFEDVQMAPGEFLAIYHRESGVSLPVSPSGSVYLLRKDQTEIDSTTYPTNSPEAASWARFDDDQWKYTYLPTPGESNTHLDMRPCPEGQERSAETNRCRSIATSQTEFEPCGPGRERNPETNRCRNITVSTNELTPCEPGRVRNPETNRCRNITSASNSLVPCAPNQERNPETNRCRLIQSGSSLVPCGPDQERNPETNRCRRVAAANSAAIGEVEDFFVTTEATPFSWRIVIFAGILALLYGAWEWREELRGLWRKIAPRKA